eukprot:scaffold3420_cov115-Isochrysis_galbana.AAC.4
MPAQTPSDLASDPQPPVGRVGPTAGTRHAHHPKSRGRCAMGHGARPQGPPPALPARKAHRRPTRAPDRHTGRTGGDAAAGGGAGGGGGGPAALERALPSLEPAQSCGASGTGPHPLPLPTDRGRGKGGGKGAAASVAAAKAKRVTHLACA